LYTKFQRQNQQNNGKIQPLIKTFSFASPIGFFGSSAGFSKAKIRIQRPKTWPLLFHLMACAKASPFSEC